MDKSEWIEAILSRYSRSLIRYATSILKDQESAKEVVQECFLKLLQQDPDAMAGGVQSWLYRECRNRSIDLWRKRKHTEPLADNFDDLVENGGPNPHESLETSQNVASLTANMRLLSTRDQEVLRLKYSEGLSYQQIAEVMDLSPSNVGFILYQAVKTLREATASSKESVKRKYGE